jgi:hypothetical protein
MLAISLGVAGPALAQGANGGSSKPTLPTNGGANPPPYRQAGEPTVTCSDGKAAKRIVIKDTKDETIVHLTCKR